MPPTTPTENKQANTHECISRLKKTPGQDRKSLALNGALAAAGVFLRRFPLSAAPYGQPACFCTTPGTRHASMFAPKMHHTQKKKSFGSVYVPDPRMPREYPGREKRLGVGRQGRLATKTKTNPPEASLRTRIPVLSFLKLLIISLSIPTCGHARSSKFGE